MKIKFNRKFCSEFQGELIKNMGKIMHKHMSTGEVEVGRFFSEYIIMFVKLWYKIVAHKLFHI